MRNCLRTVLFKDERILKKMHHQNFKYFMSENCRKILRQFSDNKNIRSCTYVVNWNICDVRKDQEMLQSELKPCSNIICLPETVTASVVAIVVAFELFCVNCFVFIFY